MHRRRPGAEFGGRKKTGTPKFLNDLFWETTSIFTPKISDDLFCHRLYFSDFPCLYCVKYWGTDAWAVPPPQILLGRDSPSVSPKYQPIRRCVCALLSLACIK